MLGSQSSLGVAVEYKVRPCSEVAEGKRSFLALRIPMLGVTFLTRLLAKPLPRQAEGQLDRGERLFAELV